MTDFIHLHVHSDYSLLDGLGKLDLLIAKAKEYGMDSLALTDHGSMYGSFKFYLKAKAQGIKPIIGVETYMARRTRFDKEAKLDTDSYHLLLLAENEIGYKNLLKLVTHAHLEGFYYKPRIDWDLLKAHSEGIICTSACMQGQVPYLLRMDKEEEAEKIALEYAKLFGPEHYYIELQRHPNIAEIEPLNEKLVKLARKLGLPLVATNDVHYVAKDDAEAQDILLCVQTQTTVLDKSRKLSMISSPDFYLRSPSEMQELFPEYPEALANTVKIANRCELNLSVGKWILPDYPLPSGETPESNLRKIVYERLPKKYPNVTQEIKDRIEYELDIINTKGYSTYFLIVQDFVNWAKNNGVGVGPGRGSAAGSIVTYILNITGLDPLYFNLPFERFLNPYRPSAPDIDLDFADDKREEVITYVTAKYGSDRVAQICTFGTMEARGAVRDAGRALGMPYSGPDRISKMIPMGFQGAAMTIEKALEQSSELAHAYRTEADTKRLLDVAKKLEGVARHASVHAAGVVIADKPIVEYAPLQREARGEKIVTQYDMYTIGEDGVGLLKMDFLGLRNLTIMSNALRLIKDVSGTVVDMDKIPFNDKKAFDLLAIGETTGIFQLESAGMRRYIKELKPTNIYDLMAMVALYRPGPMQTIPEFIKRKNNPSQIEFPDPRLKDVLAQSYGIICYQDDVLLTAITLAGYSWGDADKLRKAVGKKIPIEMKKQHEKFVDGCVKNGLSISKAENIWNLIEPFAGYGFNKAHAACYGMIAYQTAYLKANYPVEFMTAVFTAESRANTGPARDEKMGIILDECKRMKIPILLPDINNSVTDFSTNGVSIRLGLSAVKNVGAAAIESILASKKNGGEFKSYYDFLNRIDGSKVNRKVIESLIKSGAFDSFGKRAQMLLVLDDEISSISKKKKAKDDNQAGLFDLLNEEVPTVSKKLPDGEEFDQKTLLNYEKEMLGFYLTSHPLERLKKYFDDLKIAKITEVNEDKIGKQVRLGGIISTVRKVVTRTSNLEMAFLQLTDLAGTIEVVIFPKTYSKYYSILVNDNVIAINGKIDQKEDRLMLLADDIRIIDDN